MTYDDGFLGVIYLNIKHHITFEILNFFFPKCFVMINGNSFSAIIIIKILQSYVSQNRPSVWSAHLY